MQGPRFTGVVVVAGVIAACGGDEGSSGDTETTSSMASTAGSEGSGGHDGDSTAAGDDAPGSTGTPGTSTGASGPEPTGDGSESDGGTTGAAGTCAGGDFLVCEDFEAAAIGAFPDGWGLRPSGVWGGGSMGVSDEQAAWGNQSLQVQGGDVGAQWLTYLGDISAFEQGHWGRLYFRMSAPVPWPEGGVIHGDLFEARGDWEGSTHQVRWAVINNTAMLHNWGYNVQTSNAGEFIHETGYTHAWSEDWLCIEWHHDQATQHATLWVDGEEILDVPAGDDPQLPVFDDISVGWANYQSASPQFVVHIDEVVLDDARVGCLR